mgnify:CR=1 FL=1
MLAAQIYDDAVWTGTGAGTFHVAFPNYQSLSMSNYYQHAHNDYIEFLTDTGRIGFILLGGVVLISLATALTAMRKRHHPLMRGMAFASTMGIISLMIHSLTDFNLRIPGNVALFMIILALAYVAHSLPGRE